MPYSINPQSEMQQPSLGFDYLQRFSGETGDVAVFALQCRLAVTAVDQGEGYRVEPRLTNREQDGYTLQPQVYNAWLKVKTPWTYVWIGHDRPAFGLASYLDSHGLLLETLECASVFMTGTGGWGATKIFPGAILQPALPRVGDAALSKLSGNAFREPLYDRGPGVLRCVGTG